jgi:hypothetical protein
VELLSFFLGPYACLPNLLHLLLAHQILHLDSVFPIANIESIFKVLGNMFEMLIACCRGVFRVMGFEQPVATGAKATGEDKLRAHFRASSAIGQSLHSVSFLGVSTIGTLS